LKRKSAATCTVEQDSKAKALTAAQKLQNYTKTIQQTKIKIQSKNCQSHKLKYPEKAIELMQRLNLVAIENPYDEMTNHSKYQQHARRSEKNEDLVELGQ